MVCIVHDRQSISKFHCAANKIRKSNAFSVNTTRQLARICCQCSQQNLKKPIKIDVQLSTVDVDAIRLICLQLELHDYVTANSSATSSTIANYLILPFRELLNPEVQSSIVYTFLMKNQSKLNSLQKLFNFSLDFITSEASADTQNEVIRMKYDLIVKCSSYSEAIQHLNSVWAVILIENESAISLIKLSIEKLWKIFLSQFVVDDETVPFQLEKFLIRAQTNSSKNRRRPEKKERQRQNRSVMSQNILKMFSTHDNNYSDINVNVNSDYDDDYGQGIEEALVESPRFSYLSQIFQTSSKRVRSRIHRRQHMLASAILT